VSIESELSPVVRELLDAVGYEQDPPQSRRVFTNRDLDLDTIQVVGFDMDYTLARYRRRSLDALTIEKTVEKLVGRGYPEELQSLQYDPEFAIRGLVVDRHLGNILKMDRHGYVGRAYHGRGLLGREERKFIYRAQRVGQEKDRFFYVDTMFSLPEMSIYAAVVDMIDRHPERWPGGAPSYSEAFADTRDSVDRCHQDDTIKAAIKSDPEAFIRDDTELALALHKLRKAGKRLFLLTNSYARFSDAVLGHLLNGRIDGYPHWTDYFDWMVMGSKKPQFFTETKFFQEVDRDDRELGDAVAVPEMGKTYVHGSQAGLQRAMNVEPDEVLYVGDHIYGDVVKSKKSSGWRTVLVVAELEHEISMRTSWRTEVAEIEMLSDLREQVEEDISRQRHFLQGLGRAEETVEGLHGLDGEDAASQLRSLHVDANDRLTRLRAHEAELTATLDARIAQVDHAFNPYWGSLFAERRDASMFGAQVENFACLYTSRVSNFLHVSPVRYFHAPHGSMPHWKVR